MFFDGAAFGALPAIVGRDRIGSANSAIWGFGSLLDLGIPMLAGVLLAVVHPATLLALDGLSFLLSAACVASIRTRLSAQRFGVPALRPRVLLTEVGVGLRFLWGHAGVRSQTVVGFLLSLSGAGLHVAVRAVCRPAPRGRHQRLALRAGLRGLGRRRHPRGGVARPGCCGSSRRTGWR